jgi:hypothetical protein
VEAPAFVPTIALVPATRFEIALPAEPEFVLATTPVAAPAPELANVEGFDPAGAEPLPGLVGLSVPGELVCVGDIAVVAWAVLGLVLVIAECCDLSLV